LQKIVESKNSDHDVSAEIKDNISE